MNSEKIQALFESMEVAADELKKATAAANKIRIANSNEEKITKIISDFNAIQSNTEQVRRESLNAIKSIRKEYIAYKITGVIGLFLTTSLLGLGIGYASIISQKNIIIAHEIRAIEEERSRIQSQYGFINELQKKGLMLYSEGIVIPQEYANKIQRLNDGRAIILKNK